MASSANFSSITCWVVTPERAAKPALALTMLTAASAVMAALVAPCVSASACMSKISA